MQETNKKILSTADLDDTLITVAKEKGFLVDTIPFIRTEEINSEDIKKQITELAFYLGVLAWSMRL